MATTVDLPDIRLHKKECRPIAVSEVHCSWTTGLVSFSPKIFRFLIVYMIVNVRKKTNSRKRAATRNALSAPGSQKINIKVRRSQKTAQGSVLAVSASESITYCSHVLSMCSLRLTLEPSFCCGHYWGCRKRLWNCSGRFVSMTTPGSPRGSRGDSIDECCPESSFLESPQSFASCSRGRADVIL